MYRASFIIFIITKNAHLISQKYVTKASLYIIHIPTCFDISMSSSGSSKSAPY